MENDSESPRGCLPTWVWVLLGRRLEGALAEKLVRLRKHPHNKDRSMQSIIRELVEKGLDGTGELKV